MSEFYARLSALSANSKPYIIAEVGSNYRNDDDLMGSIALAKSAGADAVKFQYLNPDELYGPAPLADFPLERLAIKAKATGIDFLCSAFSVKGMERVNEFVPAHKIASCEMSHLRLLEFAKSTGKTILLSTGAHFMPDISRVLKWLGAAPVVPMHCNVAYPARFTDSAKFQAIQELAPITGWSDHTTNIDIVPVFYFQNGATVIEKHFNPFGLKDTPDAPHSLTTSEFKAMSACLRTGQIDQLSEENDARLLHVRRIVAIADISPGDVLKEGVNIGIYRSRVQDDSGLHPFLIDRVNGKAAQRKVSAGFGIARGDVSGL